MLIVPNKGATFVDLSQQSNFLNGKATSLAKSKVKKKTPRAKKRRHFLIPVRIRMSTRRKRMSLGKKTTTGKPLSQPNGMLTSTE